MSFLSESPELTALVFLIIGVLAARWLSGRAVGAVRRLEDLLFSIAPRAGSYRLSELHEPAIRQVTFYLLLAVVLLFALQILGVNALTTSFDSLLVYVPQLIMGIFIILVGYVLSVAARNVVASLMSTDQPSALPRVAQVIVVVVAIITGLEQMQFDISFMGNLIMVVMAGLLLGISIAFAMGARQLVANLLSARELTRYRIGDSIRILDRSGAIQEIHRTGVVVRTGEGQVNIPASMFAENLVTLLDPAAQE